MSLRDLMIPAEESFTIDPFDSLESYLDSCLESYVGKLEYKLAYASALEAEGDSGDNTGKIDSIVSRIKSSVSKFRSGKSSGDESKMDEAKSELAKESTELAAESRKPMSEARKKKLKLGIGAITAGVLLMAGGTALQLKAGDAQIAQMKRQTEEILNRVKSPAMMTAGI